HFGLAVAHDHVDLAAYAELRQVDAGLDGEAGVGDDLAVVLGLEVVHVGAGGVDLDPDRVPGAMRKIFSVTFRGDVVARRLVHFPAADAALGREGVLYDFDTGIASAAHDLEDLLLLGGRLTHDARPRDVVVDRVRFVELRPHVEQNEVAVADRLGRLRR